MGDFKLLAMLGAWMGWQSLPLIIILSSFAGALIGGTLILFGRDKAKPIPFGPYLAIAGWIALIWGRCPNSKLPAIRGDIMFMGHFVLGLTGGIGSGKTAVSDHFQSLGITIADADIAARQVVEPGTEPLRRIAEHFGSKILLANGSLDRARLRGIIFC